MTGLINAIGEIISAIVSGLFQGLIEIADAIGKKNHDKSATFGREKKVFSYSSGSSLYIGTRAINPKVALNSALIIGRTGSGKSTKVYKPSLLETPPPKIEPNHSASMSYVVLDPSGELERDTAGYNHGRGYLIETINFSDASASTVSWNPIAQLTHSGVNRFASEFIETSLRNSNSNDPFWGLSASRVIAFSIHLLRQFGEVYTNLYNVRYVVQSLSGDREKLDLLLSLPTISNDLFERYVSIVNMGSKLLSSVLATTLASLEIFEDPEVVKVTSSSSLNMVSLRELSTILYVQTPVMNQEYVSVLNTLLFSSFFSHCMSTIPDDQQNTVAFFIDECSSLRMKPSLLPLACSNLRKHRAYGVFGFQSIAQIEELYGRVNARTIRQNVGTTLYMPHQDLESSKEISEMLGSYTYMEKEAKHERKLLTTDEVSFLKHQEGGILFSGSERGILLKNITPYYKHRKQRKRSQVVAPDLEHLESGMPPILPIDHIIKNNIL